VAIFDIFFHIQLIIFTFYRKKYVYLILDEIIKINYSELSINNIDKKQGLEIIININFKILILL